nr:EOG090X07RL [Eulimnadia texana]
MAGVRRGVLRKKKSEEETGKLDDLLVFGYACKLFRDDEKALYIDQGKHLIPWMGDEDLKIDRYDARGALYDLKPLEYKSGSFGRFDGLTAEEKQVEELCDHERYFALYKDEREEALYQEEEMKRLQLELNEVTSAEDTYHQVPFSYSGQENEKMSENHSSENAQKSVQGEIGDAVFVPPPEMDIPPDILVPPTVKLALIIQKTAQFITTQGTQMEIVLKAKQANNPMFEFLNFDSALQPYYKFVCTAIRNGTYVPVEEPAEEVKPETTEEKQQTDSEDSDNDSYLHPSLQPKTVVTTPPEETGSTEVTPFVHPPPDVQPIVDKTASYVARNGRHLESVIRSKGDPRFTFLQPDHAYHAYYLQKLTVYSEMLGNKADQKHKATEPKEEISAVPEDPEEKLKSERRMKAAAFLDQIKKKISMTIRPGGIINKLN